VIVGTIERKKKGYRNGYACRFEEHMFLFPVHKAGAFQVELNENEKA
jgi:hypothetical protein